MSGTTPSSLARRLRVSQAVFVAILPVVVLLVPSRWVERHHPPCLFSAVFGVRCPGCGMTRAVSCAAHGRLREALRYNPLVVLVLPLAVGAWLGFARDTVRELSEVA